MPNERGPVGGAGELTGYGWNVEQILVYIWQNLSGGSSEQEYPYSRFANSEAGKRLRVELAELAAKAPQGVDLAELRELLADARANHSDWAGYLVHKSDLTQQVMEFDAHCPKCVIDKALTLLTAPVSDDTIHHGMVAPAVTNIRETVQKLHDKASSDAGTWHSTTAYSREERARWMVFYEGRKAAFGELLGMLGEAAAPKPAPHTPDADAIEASSTEDAKLWQPACPHVATPAPRVERPADGYGKVLSIIDRWQRFHIKPDQFVAALREALAAAPPAPITSVEAAPHDPSAYQGHAGVRRYAGESR